jgi:hypothetical protein
MGGKSVYIFNRLNATMLCSQEGITQMKRYRIRITSGDWNGRYVGLSFAGGLVTNPEVQQNPPANIPGYGLWIQERAATQFFEAKAVSVQAELNALGYSSELIEF